MVKTQRDWPICSQVLTVRKCPRMQFRDKMSVGPHSRPARSVWPRGRVGLRYCPSPAAKAGGNVSFFTPAHRGTLLTRRTHAVNSRQAQRWVLADPYGHAAPHADCTTQAVGVLRPVCFRGDELKVFRVDAAGVVAFVRNLEQGGIPRSKHALLHPLVQHHDVMCIELSSMKFHHWIPSEGALANCVRTQQASIFPAPLAITSNATHHLPEVLGVLVCQPLVGSLSGSCWGTPGGRRNGRSSRRHAW